MIFGKKSLDKLGSMAGQTVRKVRNLGGQIATITVDGTLPKPIRFATGLWPERSFLAEYPLQSRSFRAR